MEKSGPAKATMILSSAEIGGSGFSAQKKNHGGGFCGAYISGCSFMDHADDCDRNECQLACAAPTNEAPKW